MLFVFAPAAQALERDGRPKLVFAAVEQGRELLTRRDEFIARLSPFDRSARLKTSRPVSEEEFLAHVSASVLAWTEEEKRKLEEVFAGLPPALRGAARYMPETLILIKTTGEEEGTSMYTRANAIVIPQGFLGSIDKRRRLLVHEMFHILTRANPGLRDRLYASIGFLPCVEPELPAELEAGRVTNPDAPRNSHHIRVRVDGEAAWVVPLIYASTEAYSGGRGGEFIEHVRSGLLLTGLDSSRRRPGPLRAGERASLVPMSRVSGYFERIGRNTGYNIHPEETLAENFALLMMGEKDVPTPRVLERMSRILYGEGGDGMPLREPGPR